MKARPCFNPYQLRVVRRAGAQAETLVTDYYRVAPREWRRMRYEVRTLRALNSTEIADSALAQMVCYGYRREAGPILLEEGELYRICLQDHRILDAARTNRIRLESLLTYVLTHELVHIVRFGQQLERMDLPRAFRADEEQKVERTTRAILEKTTDPEIGRILSEGFESLH